MKLELKQGKRLGIEIYTPKVTYRGMTYSSQFMSYNAAFTWLARTASQLAKKAG